MAPKYDDHFAAKAQSSADPVVADDPADEVEWLAERQPGDRDDLGDVDGHRISTWGGPGAGKSTFLAALNRAALTATGDSIGWTLAPADPASAAYLAAAETQLNAGAFPGQSLEREIYYFALLRRSQSDGTGVVRAELRVTDGPGIDTAMNADGTAPSGDIEELLESDGFLFLFDPTLRAKGKSNAATLDPLVAFLKHRAEEEQTWVDARLRHHIAVCVTKFDNEEVFRRSLRGGWVNQDPDTRLPHVRSTDAEKYFAWLCGELGETGVYQAIQRAFHPDRVRFFVSSAIGFHVAPGRTFDSHANNPFNYDARPGTPLIRGPVHPINVLEPVVWLQDGLGRHDGRS